MIGQEKHLDNEIFQRSGKSEGGDLQIMEVCDRSGETSGQ